MYRLKCPIFSLSVLLFAGPVAAQYIDGINDQVLNRVASKYGDQARTRVADWKKLMDTNADPQNAVSENKKLKTSNSFFNKIRWVSDQKHWGREDYWATPIEMLGTNGGDCEDYSIAKYFTLKDTDVSTSKLRITYVKAIEYNQAHMVLAYYKTPDAEPLIMDNINLRILPASQRNDLLPVYSFNGENLWLAKARGKKLKASSQRSLPQWRKLNEKLLAEVM
ncbi:transglutaminase-like cysteine peptidase [Pseudoteredinibacter isoporae]|uniref:Putative transglutaminase-like cysteine proteinase n=1 Tax=Pseudoteredinibacter isoporae TaxID=570281 RepID=A0A7X0JXU3_9GAMM|nr:transglutaminase-like cysteine peptidase [Pseudoteredinibacter isoporae]MBB6523406.1 putative transglutaminase-like cysteine proteinase [Pseudoteredinibacter isoporae]